MNGRVTARFRPRRRTGGQRSLAMRLAALLVAGAVVASLVYLAMTAQRSVPLISYYNLKAAFQNAQNLDSYAVVRIAGKRVGQVTGTSFTRGLAVADLELRGVRALPIDTRARIRLEGLLGATFVELIPGHDKQTLPPGTTIPASSTSTTTSLFDVIGTFDPRRRADLRATLRGLGEGFLGRGSQLNNALTVAPTTFRDTTTVANAVNARAGAAQRFFPDTESAAAAFDPVRWDMALGWDPEARALAPFADQRAAIQGMLEQAPPALSAIQQGLAENQPLLRETAAFARATIELTNPAPSALRAATALLRASPAPLQTTQTLLNQAAAAIPPTLRLLTSINPLIEPSIRSLKNNIPGFNALAIRGCDFLGTLANWRDALAYGTQGGGSIGPANVFRTQLYAGPESIGSDGTAKPQTVIGHDRNPPPCRAATEHLPVP
jgi:phospholipid/cholesterol/gamma-HCH transport system substrate-binding protein